MIHGCAVFVRTHLTEIAISLTAMILVVLSPILNKGMKAVAGPLPWLVRYGLFVLFTTLGSGMLTLFGVRFLQAGLRALTDAQLVGAVAGAHLLIAWILKRENHI